MYRKSNNPTIPHDVDVFPCRWDENGKPDMYPLKITEKVVPGGNSHTEASEVIKAYTVAEMRKKATAARKKLWGNYWETGQLCILAGDLGSGKSTLALQLGKAISTGTTLMDYENESEAQKVLYIGFELEGEDFFLRYGEEDENANFCYSNLHSAAFLPGIGTTPTEKLIFGLETLLKETEAKIIIIDQPDRLHISPSWWSYFMLKLNELKVRQELSIMITLNNKPRNINRVPSTGNMYKGNLLVQHADSIVALANQAYRLGGKYLKSLKNNRQPACPVGSPVETFHISIQKPYFLLQRWEDQPEEGVLPFSPTRAKQNKMMEAEALRHEGMPFKEIAGYMELPERLIRSWTRFIKPEQTLEEYEAQRRLYGWDLDELAGRVSEEQELASPPNPPETSSGQAISHKEGEQSPNDNKAIVNDPEGLLTEEEKAAKQAQYDAILKRMNPTVVSLLNGRKAGL